MLGASSNFIVCSYPIIIYSAEIVCFVCVSWLYLLLTTDCRLNTLIKK